MFEYIETFKYISLYNKYTCNNLLFKNKKLKRKKAINYNRETTPQLLNLPSIIIEIQ